MATGSWPTYQDLLSRMDGAGKQAYIAEMLSQSIVVTKDMPMMEANEVGSHEWVLRTSIPTGYFRSANQGVPYGKSTTAKARTGIASLEGWSQVDKMIAEDSGDIETFRQNEDVAFLEGMGQTIEQTIWYGNTATNPLQFQGLSTFYNTVNTATAANAANVIDGGGTGNSNMSIWLVCWGMRTIHGVYPRGSIAGLHSDDRADTVPGYDAVGNPFMAYTMWFRQQMAVIPQDWRFAARICNLDVTANGLAGPNAYDIFTGIRKLYLLPPYLGKPSGITETDAPNDPAPGMRPVLYVCRTGRAFMDIQAMRDRNVLLRLTDYAGMPIDGVNDVPLRVSDQLLTTEARVT